MKKYICQKRSRFGDRVYLIGEEIPAELIAPSRVSVLRKYGTISVIDAPDEPTADAQQPPVETEPPADDAAGDAGNTGDTGEQPPVGTEPQEKPAKDGGKKAKK